MEKEWGSRRKKKTVRGTREEWGKKKRGVGGINNYLTNMQNANFWELKCQKRNIIEDCLWVAISAGWAIQWIQARTLASNGRTKMFKLVAQILQQIDPLYLLVHSVTLWLVSLNLFLFLVNPNILLHRLSTATSIVAQISLWTIWSC